MSLVGIREQFVKYSGRYDLVLDRLSWNDNGANFFIRAGQRWLDRQSTHIQSEAIHYATLPLNSWYYLLPHSRSIRNVSLSNSEGAKWILKKVRFPNEASDPGLQDSGKISCYSIGVTRDSPGNPGTITLGQFGPVTYTTAGDHWNFQALLFNVPGLEEYGLEVEGLFYHPLLIEDTDENFWSEEHPQVLVQAACRQLEVSYRNTAGVRDWDEAIAAELLTLEFDLVDQESHGIHQIRG